MIPGEFPVKIYRGSTFKHTITAKIADVDIDFGVDYDSAEMQIRRAWVNNGGTEEPLMTLSTANGKLIFEGILLKMVLTSTETEAIVFNSGSYDLELRKLGTPDIVDKLLYGSVTILGELTV